MAVPLSARAPLARFRGDGMTMLRQVCVPSFIKNNLHNLKKDSGKRLPERVSTRRRRRF
jgi:hypothetical protein